MYISNVLRFSILPVFLSLAACGGGGSGGSEKTGAASPGPSPLPSASPSSAPSPTVSPSPLPDPDEPLVENMKMYIFGHSLINHEDTPNPPPSNENSVPHWMVQFAGAEELSYSADGQYGFLRNHTDFPPNPQWDFDLIDQAWRSNGSQSFADVNFTTVMLTPANFIQYQAADAPYDGSNPTNTSPLAETLTLIDWIAEQEPNATIYIYENWPEMGVYPPNSTQLANFHNQTLTTFHEWWEDYHDSVMAARPSLNVRMIPVGPIIATVLTSTELSNIPVTDLYEDGDPHGRPTIYFLAGLITYMATYGVPAPGSFTVPSTVHSDVQTHYDDVVMTIWSALHTYNNAGGDSRVF